ncbi:integrase, partial [Acinetobacter baumannii]
FPRKVSKGNTFTPKRKLHLPSQILPLIKDIISEIQSLTKKCRVTAVEMHRSQTVDLRFLENCPKKIYKNDLRKLGISPSILDSRS